MCDYGCFAFVIDCVSGLIGLMNCWFVSDSVAVFAFLLMWFALFN